MAFSSRQPPKKYGDDFNRRDSGDFEESRMKASFFTSVKQYNMSKSSFKCAYASWLPLRRATLAELRSLYAKVHEEALNYNKKQANLKEISYNSRIVKQEVENETISFFCSLAEFIGDAGSGISSVVQACNVDSARTEFKEIMERDAAFTKILLAARTRCVAEYEGIEEIMRSFKFNTFDSTMNKLSDTFEAMGHAYRQDDMPKLLNTDGNFFDKAPNVISVIQEYVDDNPETVDACKSTGKVIFRAIDNFGDKKSKDEKSLVRRTTNALMMVNDRKEIEHLRYVVAREDTCQSKLESQIEEAIRLLESEMGEMIDMYSRWSMNRTYNDDSD